jgi:hypothetical protein
MAFRNSLPCWNLDQIDKTTALFIIQQPNNAVIQQEMASAFKAPALATKGRNLACPLHRDSSHSPNHALGSILWRKIR